MKILYNPTIENILEQLGDIEEYVHSNYNKIPYWLYSNLMDYIEITSYNLMEVSTTETCSTCSKKLLCKQADRMKLETGCKLTEMWFNCWEGDTK